jgi:hypothetical protein
MYSFALWFSCCVQTYSFHSEYKWVCLSFKSWCHAWRLCYCNITEDIGRIGTVVGVLQQFVLGRESGFRQIISKLDFRNRELTDVLGAVNVILACFGLLLLFLTRKCGWILSLLEFGCWGDVHNSSRNKINLMMI